MSHKPGHKDKKPKKPKKKDQIERTNKGLWSIHGVFFKHRNIVKKEVK